MSPIVPWAHEWTRRKRRAILQGSDFVDVVTFPVTGGIAINWTGFLVRAQLRNDFADATNGFLAEIDCTIIDPVARTVRFRIPAAVTRTLAAQCCAGRWDAELYRFDTEGTETDTARIAQGRWELSQEVTRA
jgi:hypothetical protein